MVTEWRSNSKAERDRPPSTGCVSSMLQFFGCRTHTATSLQPEQQQQHLHEEASRPGDIPASEVDAPRNSLELYDAGEQYYGVPIGIQIERRRPTVAGDEENQRKTEALTPRNRSIVAQLMGLEVSEYDISSPRDSFSAAVLSNDNLEISVKKNNKKKKEKELVLRSPRQALRNLNPNVSGSISLPETPRPSSERAREIEPARYSLQLNKENINSYTMPEIAGACFPRDRSLPVTSKKALAKKENLSVMEESKAQRSQSIAREITERKIIKHSSSFKAEHKFPETTKKIQRNPSPAPLPSTKLLKPKAHDIEPKTVKMEPRGKCSKASNERFTEKIRRSAPDQLTKINKKLLKLNTNYNEAQQVGPTPADEQEPLITNPLISGKLRKKRDPDYRYVKAILARAGVVGGAKAVKWFSPSLPIDPTIFHALEIREAEKAEEVAARPDQLRHRWNRKLLFHLVEEIVGDLLLSEPNRWRRSGGEELLFSLWSRIKGLPTADCRVVGDIDALVAGDLSESKVRRILRHPSVAAAAQDVAVEIELGILESLVGEIFR